MCFLYIFKRVEVASTDEKMHKMVTYNIYIVFKLIFFVDCDHEPISQEVRAALHVKTREYDGCRLKKWRQIASTIQ